MENSKSRRLFQVLFFALVVLVLPLGSLMVNLKGAAKGKAFYSTLKNKYGKVLAFNNASWMNDSVNTAKIKGKVMVFAFITPENRDTIMNVMRQVVKVQQFRDEVDNLTFLTFDTKEDSVYAASYVQTMNITDHKMWKILRGGNDLKTAFKLPNDFNVALVDTANEIRCYYDTRKAEDRKLLVEHISVMPIRKDKNPEKRDQKQF